MQFKPIPTSNPDIQRLQTNLGLMFAPFDVQNLRKVTQGRPGTTDKTTSEPLPAFFPFSDGTVVTINLFAQDGSGNPFDNLVPHGLQAVPKFWSVIRLNANANVWEEVSNSLLDPSNRATSATDTHLNLRCSADCTVTLWIS